MDQATLIAKLTGAVGADYIHTDPVALRAYNCDALTIYKGQPSAVVLPADTEQVQQVVRLCREAGVPLIPRGAGTCLSGGATPAPGGVLAVFVRMNQILEIDYENRLARVQPGVVNLHLSRETLPRGFHYAPDPSSQMACTIGGNAAENSGGAHCLKYGMTTNHIQGMTVVLASGDAVRLGSDGDEAPGLDLRGFFIGSEGTFAVTTELTVRLTPNPEGVRTMLACFKEVGDACRTVSEVIAAGAVPAAMELMDRYTIEAVEKVMQAGYPKDAGAVLLIELDGLPSSMRPLEALIHGICMRNACASFRAAQSEAERDSLWMGRKRAFGAFGAIAPAYYCLDGTVPRSKLAVVLEEFDRIAARYGLRITNVFHAGDGSLHPNVLFDDRVPGETARAVECGAEVLRACIRAGGVLSGEHGIGIEKKREMRDQFDDATLGIMERVRDAVDPEGLFNPGKILPGGDVEFPLADASQPGGVARMAAAFSK
ncbi:MAG: FAD-binding protein [Candidatus Tectomicrobia bacterium]|nr:FAD-binding protein [Candidatus Tectomicrobia bacterium]